MELQWRGELGDLPLPQGTVAEEATPDHTTLCRFRERLNEVGLTVKLLALVNAQIEAKGLLLKRGTLIDATVVETAAARPEKADDPTERIDPDAAFLKRAGKAGSSYGYKAHVAADEGSLLVRTAKLTSANVAETVVADELIIANRDGGMIYAAKAYILMPGATSGQAWPQGRHHASAEQASSSYA